MVRIEDVAKLAGVSVTTVSRVMNGKPNISSKTRQKVENAISELDYHPSQLARNLYNQKTQIIGVVVPDVSHGYYAKLVRYIEEALCARDYKMLLCNAHQKKNLEKDYIYMLRCNQVDGIIIASHTLQDSEYMRLDLPLVSIDRYLGETIPFVASNHKQGGHLAADELIRAGCKKIVQLACNTAIVKPADDRHFAFSDRLKKAGIQCNNVELPLHEFGYEYYQKVVQEIFEMYPSVDGIFCADNIACAVLQEAHKRGIEVPGELQVVGYDGNEVTKMVTPTLTTVGQRVQEIAYTAVEVLLKKVNKKETQGAYRISVDLIQGESTCPLDVSD